jgi:hypothetical protein
MAATHRSITLIALVSVLSVPAVSGFAQTNTNAPDDTDPQQSSTTAARVYVAARSAAYDGIRLASNLTVTSLYQTVIDTMLERSPTFRRQYARISQATGLTIELRNEPRANGLSFAWTTIFRRQDVPNQRHAVVNIVPGTRAVELIAHELEHVIEQLDGVNLREKAAWRTSGVRSCECGDKERFETERAIAVGLQVAREVDDPGNRGQ